MEFADQPARQQTFAARLERLPFHRWHLKMGAFVASATFFDGLDAVMISFVMPVLIPLWKIRPTQVGLLISSGYIGQLLGSFSSDGMRKSMAACAR